LVDKPDYLNFIGSADGGPPECGEEQLSKSKCGTRAAISALDGLLTAEKEANLTGSPYLAVAWSMNAMFSIDGSVTGAGISAFHDMESSVADPTLVEYNDVHLSQEDLAAAWDTRGINALDTQSPWEFLTAQIVEKYSVLSKPARPWFIADFDYAVPQGRKLADSLPAMGAAAVDSSNPFIGAVFTKFQRDYTLNSGVLGMFGLGSAKSESYGHVTPCWEDVLTGVQHCDTLTVYCLDVAAGDPGRADAMNTAWGGSMRLQGTCNKTSAKVQQVLV
jgi:hypothetical protein